MIEMVTSRPNRIHRREGGIPFGSPFSRELLRAAWREVTRSQQLAAKRGLHHPGPVRGFAHVNVRRQPRRGPVTIGHLRDKIPYLSCPNQGNGTTAETGPRHADAETAADATARIPLSRPVPARHLEIVPQTDVAGVHQLAQQDRRRRAAWPPPPATSARSP